MKKKEDEIVIRNGFIRSKSNHWHNITSFHCFLVDDKCILGFKNDSEHITKLNVMVSLGIFESSDEAQNALDKCFNLTFDRGDSD